MFRIPGRGEWFARAGRGLSVGGFDTEEEAAIAYDRSARHHKRLRRRLNFPERELKPASVEDVRRELRKSRGYVGVHLTSNGKFAASVSINGETFAAGVWRTAKQAALARDRAALALGCHESRLNLPREALRVGPMLPEALRREARVTGHTQQHTSRYFCVQWDSGVQTWRAFISHQAKYTPLGVFDDEREAAIARDRVWLHLGGKRSLLNFPALKLAPLSIRQMREEARLRSKQQLRASITA